MGTDAWSKEEDRQPGKQIIRVQPEMTARGEIYTQRVTYWHRQLKPDEPDFECSVLIKIRKCAGDYLFDHGTVWPVRREDENDGA